jgi:hypothetical protein
MAQRSKARSIRASDHRILRRDSLDMVVDRVTIEDDSGDERAGRRGGQRTASISARCRSRIASGPLSELRLEDSRQGQAPSRPQRADLVRAPYQPPTPSTVTVTIRAHGEHSLDGRGDGGGLTGEWQEGGPAWTTQTWTPDTVVRHSVVIRRARNHRRHGGSTADPRDAWYSNAASRIHLGTTPCRPSAPDSSRGRFSVGRAHRSAARRSARGRVRGPSTGGPSTGARRVPTLGVARTPPR